MRIGIVISTSRSVAWDCVLFNLEGLPEPVLISGISVPRFLYIIGSVGTGEHENPNCK